jgi:hypothetical protein
MPRFEHCLNPTALNHEIMPRERILDDEDFKCREQPFYLFGQILGLPSCAQMRRYD